MSESPGVPDAAKDSPVLSDLTGAARAVDLAARSFDLARPGVARHCWTSLCGWVRAMGIEYRRWFRPQLEKKWRILRNCKPYSCPETLSWRLI